MMKGAWDSIHVIEVEIKGKTALYKLTSSVLLYMVTANNAIGTMNLGGNLTRQNQQELPFHDASDHIINIGKIVEEMEIKMRMAIQEIYFGKTKDVVNELRSTANLVELRKQADMQREIMNKMQERNK